MVIETNTQNQFNLIDFSLLVSISLCLIIVYDGCVRDGARSLRIALHRTTTHKYTLMHNENPFTSINFQINYNIFHFNWYGTIASIRIHFNIHHELHVNYMPTLPSPPSTNAATFTVCICGRWPPLHPPLNRNCFRIKTNRMVKVDLYAIDSIYLTVD